jgi:hypothetical protein
MHLSSKHKAVGSNPSIAKREGRKEGGRKRRRNTTKRRMSSKLTHMQPFGDQKLLLHMATGELRLPGNTDLCRSSSPEVAIPWTLDHSRFTERVLSSPCAPP